jgi:hypothetical protein
VYLYARNEGPKASTPQAGPAAPKSSGDADGHKNLSRNASTQKTPTQHLSSAQELANILASNRPDKWRVAFQSGLNSASISDLWDIINRPDIVGQEGSKFLVSKIAFGCMQYMNVVSVNGKQPNNNPTLQSKACDQLSSASNVSAETLGKQMLAIQSDMDFQAADFRLLGFDYKATGAVASTQLSMANSALSNINSPWAQQEGVDALWRMQSTEIDPDWSEVSSLSRFQQNRLQEIVSTDMACNSIGGCGPDSPWTLSLCASALGLNCPAGMSYEEIISTNLSPNEISLRNKILSSLYSYVQNGG